MGSLSCCFGSDYADLIAAGTASGVGHPPTRRHNPDVGMLNPAPLVAPTGKDLLDRLPEAERAVADRDFRGDVQPTALHVDQQFAPALDAFPYAGLKADKFFLALGRRADQHQHAFAVILHAGLQVNAVRPGISVVGEPIDRASAIAHIRPSIRPSAWKSP